MQKYLLFSKKYFKHEKMNTHNFIELSVYLIPIEKTQAKISKIIWFICFFISCAFAGCLVKQTIDDYFKYPVMSQIRQYTEKKVDFPSIAICNSNPFVSNFSIEFIVDYLETYTNFSFKSAKKCNNELTKLNFIKKIAINKPYIFSAIHTFAYNFLNESEQQKLGFSLDQILIKCEFKNEICQQQQFKWIYDLRNGGCYVFNMLEYKTLTVSSSGIDTSLSLEIYVGNEKSFAPSFYNSYGLKLMIFNQSKTNQFTHNFERISVQTGTELSIALQRSYVDRLSKPYSECELYVKSSAKSFC
jgi:hypothetical protein